MKKLVLISLISLKIGLFGCLGQDSSQIMLTENSLIELKLPFEKSLDSETLKELFLKYQVTKSIQQQDGPDYVNYDIGLGKKLVASIKMKDYDATVIDRITLENQYSTDEYGIMKGMTYTEVKKKRPLISFYTDFHGGVFAFEQNSRSYIFYELEGRREGIYSYEDLTENDINDWKVDKIIWRDHRVHINDITYAFPLELFDNTTEGLDEQERFGLFETGKSDTWSRIEMDRLRLSYQNIYDRSSRITLQLNETIHDGFVLLVMTENGQNKVFETWKFNEESFQKVENLLPNVTVNDFFKTENKVRNPTDFNSILSYDLKDTGEISVEMYPSMTTPELENKKKSYKVTLEWDGEKWSLIKESI